MGVNFNRSKIFLLYFYNAYAVALVGRKLRQRYDLFMQNKSLYRISSFNEKILDTIEQCTKKDTIRIISATFTQKLSRKKDTIKIISINRKTEAQLQQTTA